MIAARRQAVILGGLCFCVLTCQTHGAHGQGSRADYLRADGLRGRFSEREVYRNRVQPQWVAGGPRFWYRIDLSGGRREFIFADPVTRERRAAFDHARLAEALTLETWRKHDAARLPLERLRFASDLSRLDFQTKGQRWTCDLRTYALSDAKAAKKPAEPPPRPRGQAQRRGRRGGQADSPDGKWTASIRNHNVWLKDKNSSEQWQLSNNGTEEDFYESRFYWSPDSSRLVVLRTKKGDDRRVTFVESSPNGQLQPKVHEHHYLKPGDNIPLRKPHLFHIGERREIAIDEALFPNPWSVSEIRWRADSGRFTFAYNQRGHQVLRVIAVDSSTGEAGPLIEETGKTFIDYAYKRFCRYLDDSHEIIWMSERDGWNHLYLYDSRTGDVKNAITRGTWVVRGVDHVDADRRRIWFRASGIYPEQDPYYIHYCRVDFDGSNFVVLTSGNGSHEATYSPDRRYLIAKYSRVDLPPVTEVRDGETGQPVMRLEQADITALTSRDWKPPERFVAAGRDGKTKIYGVIFRPTNYSADKKYPVIEKIYAGPHGSFTPKTFRAYHDHRSIAELGFIVVQMDGMGTSNRSKAFHDVCWKNLGDSGFPDRIRWIKKAASTDPSMDISRVGVYGGSAGGQSSTRALLAFGDFYKAAVSDCGCHDNRMDKIWWNELWMGWPVGPHYAEQSNVTNAHRLTGKLLLIVGELDRNVDPASTMQVVNALIKADRDFEMLVIPGGGHGIGGKYGVRRRRDFFVRHLLGVEPRWQKAAE